MNVRRAGLVLVVSALGASVLRATAPATSQPPQPSALLRDIDGIRAIDNHAHVMRPAKDDRDFDALPIDALDPSPSPVHLRPDYRPYVHAWKALFKYPYDDASNQHKKEALALKQKAMQQHGAGYPSWVLDQQGIDVILANRITMGPELQGPRFRWVPYIDALIFPLDNSSQKAMNRDYAAFYPAEEKLLQRYVVESGLRALPATLAEYTRTVVTATLERHQAGGAVGEKFEIAYLRWLDFGPAAEADAARVYAQYLKGGPPPAKDYKTLQDYLFVYTARECGRLGMPIQIHVADGGGGNYDQRGSDPLLLTWLFNEPTLRRTNFIVIHGGYPFTRSTASLLSKPNVYTDTSFLWFVIDTRTEADILREWLVAWPEKVLFASDSTPLTEEIAWEETGWVASRQTRKALALALKELIDEDEITPSRASEIARMVLRENAAKLYALK